LDVILETPGTRVGKRNEMIHINVPDRPSLDIPTREIESIIVGTGVQITSQALKAISSHAINIVYTSLGTPYGLYTPFANVGTVFTRRQQILAYDDWRGVHLATKFVYATLENKRRLLLYFAKNRKKSNHSKYVYLRKGADHIGKMIALLEERSQSFKKNETVKDIRNILMGIEGKATSTYFMTFGTLFKKEFWTMHRTRRPPRDPLNSLLSLGYTVLQGYVTTGVASAGLELYAGFLHSDRSGKPSLALDLLEEFRQPIIDRLVARLIQKKQIKGDDFENTLHGYRLKDDPKSLFYEKLRKEVLGKDTSEVLFNEETHGIEKRSRSPTKVKLNYKREIIKQARRVANFLIGATEEYEPFISNW